MVHNNHTSHLRQMVYASMFGALTAIGAFIIIPLQPIPITLQTFFTGLAGILLGGYTAALSQVVYILLGVLGLPVFAGGKAGLGILLGPTGGYLIGFVVGAFMIGTVMGMKKEAGLAWIIFALLIGEVLIYALGTLQLSLIAHLSPSKAILAGVVPFLPGEALKLAAAAAIGIRLKQVLTL